MLVVRHIAFSRPLHDLYGTISGTPMRRILFALTGLLAIASSIAFTKTNRLSSIRLAPRRFHPENLTL